MKYLLLLSIIIITSCKKEYGHCYRCEFYDDGTGYVMPTKNVCSEKVPDVFYAPNGNEVPFKCTLIR